MIHSSASIHFTSLRLTGPGDRARLVALALTAIFILFPVSLHAGPACAEHGANIGVSAHTGPVALSESQRKNLGLQTTEAAIVELGPSIDIPATLVVPPEKHGSVSAPFEGRVLEVLVKLGQTVQAGDPVVRVAPLSLGSPAQTLVSPVTGHVIRQNSMPGLPFTPEKIGRAHV